MTQHNDHVLKCSQRDISPSLLVPRVQSPFTQPTATLPKMARISILSLPTEIICEIASYLPSDHKAYVFYKFPDGKWTMYIEGAPISMVLAPITSCQTVLLVKSVAAMTRTHPDSWAVLQPRITDPEPLEILDKVGKRPAQRRPGKYWVKEVGEDGWGVVGLDRGRKERAVEEGSEMDGVGQGEVGGT